MGLCVDLNIGWDQIRGVENSSWVGSDPSTGDRLCMQLNIRSRETWRAESLYLGLERKG